MKRYINVKTGRVVETVEEFAMRDYKDQQSFNAAITTRLGSYRMIHKDSDVYVSSRCDKNWNGN